MENNPLDAHINQSSQTIRRWTLIALLVVLGLALFLAYLVVNLERAQPATKTTASRPAAAAVRLALFAVNIPAPTTITATGIPTDRRLFVTSRDGTIRIVDQHGTVAKALFLDIHQKVESSGEMGLLGLAFSPRYQTDGYFFVNYIDKNQRTVIARYHAEPSTSVVDARSERVLLTLPQPYVNHNGGDLVFGPDGYLYATLGDGGSAGDPGNRAQSLGTLFGKILRFDVRTLPYKVPKDNPFADQKGKRGEIWDYGLRNPWRISFDHVTHDLYIADVGQGSYEEIDVEQAGSTGGTNYGWHCYEGTHAFNSANCLSKDHYLFPVATYDHTQNRCSIIGGSVYRGSTYPGLQGKYFYGDFCSGQVYTLQKQGAKWQTTLAASTPYSISTFGEDNRGELYMADLKTGSIYTIEAVQ